MIVDVSWLLSLISFCFCCFLKLHPLLKGWILFQLINILSALLWHNLAFAVHQNQQRNRPDIIKLLQIFHPWVIKWDRQPRSVCSHIIKLSFAFIETHVDDFHIFLLQVDLFVMNLQIFYERFADITLHIFSLLPNPLRRGATKWGILLECWLRILPICHLERIYSQGWEGFFSDEGFTLSFPRALWFRLRPFKFWNLLYKLYSKIMKLGKNTQINHQNCFWQTLSRKLMSTVFACLYSLSRELSRSTVIVF